MSTFRAFQTGLMAGQEQAKYRREDDARMKAAEAFGKGNYEGAVSSLMGVGLMQDADAYERAGQRKQETERTQVYAKAFTSGLGAGPAPSKKTAQPAAAMTPDAGMAPPQTGLGQGPMPQPQQPNMRGGYEALRGAAASRGDFQMMAQVEQALSGMDEQQRAGFKESMEFLGQTALSLKGVPPEARGQAAMEILQNSPYANPQILQQIQQAAADGRITDEELDSFAMQTMSVADQVKRADANRPKPPEPFTLSPGQVRYGADGQRLASVPDRPQANAGQAPPSGYRWNPDGSLSKIPGGPADKPEQEYTATQVNKFVQSATTMDALQGALNQYLTLIDTVGPQMWTTGLGGDNPQVAKLQAARTNIDIQIKELFNLGVLNGPDLDIIRGAIPDVTGFNALGKSKESVRAALSVVQDYVDRGRNQIPQEFIDKARPNGNPFEQRPSNVGGWLKSLTGGAQPQQAPQAAAPRPQQQPQFPPEAISELMADPSPEAMAEFDEAFGEGAAASVMNGSR